MADDLKPRLLEPGDALISPTSLGQRGTRWLVKFFADMPEPDLSEKLAQSVVCELATHVLHLLRGVGYLNFHGYHSAAAALLRSLEDALDCFAAVLFVGGAAKKWTKNELRPSDAARAWTPLFRDVTAKRQSLSDYRRELRAKFNDYAHCCPELCAWNVYFHPRILNPKSGSARGTLELNIEPKVIASNAHSLDAHCLGYFLEFLVLIQRGYSRRLESRRHERNTLHELIEKITESMLDHDKHGCQEVRPPPEVRRLQR